MRRPLLLVPALFALLAAPPVAFADPEPEVSDGEDTPNGWDRWLSVELVGGIDTPYGLLGASLRIAPHENIVVDLGGGASRDGVRVAGGVAVSIPDREFAFQVRGGIAAGPEAWDTSATFEGPSGGLTSYTTHRYWDFTAFLDLDVGLEWRHPEGFGGRIFFGVENNLISAASSCTYTVAGVAANCDAAAGGHPIRVYAGLGVSYAFDLVR